MAVERTSPVMDRRVEERTTTVGYAGPRIVFLAPSYQPYRVPAWDVMHERLGDSFSIMALSNPPSVNDEIALRMGEFNRKIVTGGYISLSRKQKEGLETPTHLIWSPKFPLDLRSLKPDVVITSNFSTWTMTTLALGYPSVLFWEGTRHTERTVGRMRKRTREWVVRRSKAFVACGPMSRDYLIDDLGAPADKVWIGGNVPLQPPAEFRGLGPRRVVPGEPVKFLFSGQLIGRKGPEHLLHAVARLKQIIAPDSKFEVLMAGDGPQREMLEEMSRHLGVDDVVRFLGFVPIDQIWSLYEQCHVFVLPTLQDNWPLVVPESMEMGMAVMLSEYAGSVPELIRPGENGFVFDPFDHESIARQMAVYLESPARVEEHGQMSLDIVSRYTPEWAADAFIQAATYAASQR